MLKLDGNDCWFLPNNLTGHFSGPLLCWWVGTLPLCGGGGATWWLLSIFFFDGGGCTEGVEDNVLVFLPVAGLRVQGSFGISLGKQSLVNLLETDRKAASSDFQTHHQVLVARV